MWHLKERLGRKLVTTLLAASVAGFFGAGLLTRALAGDVRGQMVLGSLPALAPGKPPRAAFNWELENGVKEVLPTRVAAPRELAVVLIGAGEDKPGEQIEVTISGGALLPSTLVLRSGATLRVRNEDEIGHELFAQGLDGFSAEATSPGATRSVHLVTAGSWALRDRLAPHANAHLHVLKDLIANAKVDAGGAFAFSDVAPGKYTLKVFRGAAQVAAKEIEVTDKPLTLEPLTFGDAKASP